MKTDDIQDKALSTSLVHEWNTFLHDFQRWLMYNESLSKNTAIAYSGLLRMFFLFLEKHLGERITIPVLGALSLKDIRAFISYRSKQGVQLQSHCIVLPALKQLHLFLKDRGEDFSPSLTLLRRPKAKKILPRPLGVHQLQALLSSKPAEKDWVSWRNYALMVFLYATGVRIQEALALQHSQWHPNRGLYITGKGNKQRLLPVLPIAQEGIEVYLSLCPYKSTTKDLPLFLGVKGGRLQAPVFQQYIRTLRRQLNLSEDTTPHSMRHSFASHLLESGAPLRDVQEMLGHVSLRTTQRYMDVHKAHLSEIYKRLHPRGSMTSSPDREE